jgi:hypothetical protein
MQEYGAAHGKLHKEVRKQLIDEIIKKHRMVKKPTDEEKLKRRKGTITSRGKSGLMR